VAAHLFTASRATPIQATTPIWDAAWWNTAILRQEEGHARKATTDEQSRSYLEIVGQSTREDYHAAYSDLYGLEPVTGESWSNSYTSYRELSYRLNEVVDETEGLTMTQRVAKEIAFEDYTAETYADKPLARVAGVLVGLGYVFASWGAVQNVTVPRWRIHPNRKGEPMVTCCCLVTKTRPSEVVYLDIELPLDRRPRNPHTVEGGMITLRTAEGTGFHEEGYEGISVLLGTDDRLHLVHWITKRQRFRAKSTRPGGEPYYWNPGQRTRNPAKVPMHVHSWPIPTPVEDVIAEMKSVAAAMERTARYIEAPVSERILPWQAARMQDLDAPSESVDAMTGGDAWLQAVAEQAETHQVYRSLGTQADD
jgi:hypothetical protein